MFAHEAASNFNIDPFHLSQEQDKQAARLQTNIILMLVLIEETAWALGIHEETACSTQKLCQCESMSSEIQRLLGKLR